MIALGTVVPMSKVYRRQLDLVLLFLFFVIRSVIYHAKLRARELVIYLVVRDLL